MPVMREPKIMTGSLPLREAPQPLEGIVGIEGIVGVGRRVLGLCKRLPGSVLFEPIEGRIARQPIEEVGSLCESIVGFGRNWNRSTGRAVPMDRKAFCPEISHCVHSFSGMRFALFRQFCSEHRKRLRCTLLEVSRGSHSGPTACL